MGLVPVRVRRRLGDALHVVSVFEEWKPDHANKVSHAREQAHVAVQF